MSPHVHQRVVAAAAVMILAIVVAGAASAATTAPGTGLRPAAATFAMHSVVVGPVEATPVAYVATGANFPDALGAGPIAGITDAPILLVQKDAIPQATKAELTRLHPTRIVIVGGTAVISSAVESQLGNYATFVERLAGANRYETAAKISEASFPAAHGFVAYDTANDTVAIGETCTVYTGLSTPVTVPGPGTLIVTANVRLMIWHALSGFGDYRVYIGTSPTDCTAEIGDGGDMLSYSIIGSEPEGTFDRWLTTLRKVVHVDEAGTYQFYVTGEEWLVHKTDGASFSRGYMDVEYLPDAGM